LATIIGEETNQPSCSAGEVNMFNSTNSRLRVASSTRFWMPPGVCNGTRGIVSDVLVTERASNYLTDKDVILETALNLIE
jgi:hypothetical protein